MSKGFTDLLQDDTVTARMQLYLRMLYSEPDAEAARTALVDRRAAPTTLAVLETADFERLKVERRSRISQLITHLGKHCGPLWACLGKPECRVLVGAFANSECFWEARGRTLAENFAMFARGHFIARGEAFHADLIELLGTMSALMVTPALLSPWEGHRPSRFQLPGSQCSESMILNSDVLDETGAVRTSVPVPTASDDDRAFEVSVHRFSDGSCVLASSKVGD